LSGSSPTWGPASALCPPAKQAAKRDASQQPTKPTQGEKQDQPASGQPGGQPATAPPGTGQGQDQDNDCKGNPLQWWQQQTYANQISSVETRIVRGELLDRQPWTTRNWVIRALTAVGSVASGFTFATTSDGWIRGIGAYNGNFTPAMQTFWPDNMVGQLNRISDFGFQVNKVIAQQSSDIVVAFFPIDRFLTPTVRKMFIDSPATFFVPLAGIADPKTRCKMKELLVPTIITKEKWDTLAQSVVEMASGACSKLAKDSPSELKDACQLARIFDRLSLNVVHVLVGGTMAVDVKKIPPQITEIQIDQDKDGTATWKKATTTSPMTGVIRGSFLAGGTPTITKPEKVLQVSAVADGSSDTELHFTITLTDDLSAGTTALTFQVSKKTDGSTVTSTRDYPILHPPTAAAAEGNGKQDNENKAKAPASPTPVAPKK
jgi:hypothetical protein